MVVQGPPFGEDVRWAEEGAEQAALAEGREMLGRGRKKRRWR